MKEFFTYAGACLFGFFALFAGFKCSQAVGRIRRNDLYVYWGGGSFLSFLIAPVVVAFWGLAGGASFLVMMWLFIPESRFQSFRYSEDSSTEQQQTSVPLAGKRAERGHVQDQHSAENAAQARHIESRQTERKEQANETEGVRQWTAEEIRQMEVEKQYSGNDPIIRMRLGLPPKIDQ